MIETIFTDKAPKAIGPYSQGKKVGAFLYLSGQLALDLETGLLKEGIEAQTHQVCEHIKQLLESQDYCFQDVVKTTCFLANMEDFSAFNLIYEKYFTSKPARSLVAVKTLPKNALVEIEVIAYKE